MGLLRARAHKVIVRLLGAPGGEPSDAAALWSDAATDRGATITGGIGEPQTGPDFGDKRGQGRKGL